LYLTRQQLTAYNVDNVPSDDPEGQSIDTLSIPGVYPPQGQSVDLQPLPQADLQNLVLPDLKQIFAERLVRELFRSHEGDASDIQTFVENNFANVSKYYGTEYDKPSLTAVKIDFINRWPYRHYEVDDASVKTTCNDSELTCDVNGEISYQFGLVLNKTVQSGRSAFHFTVFSPGDNPRITVEEGKLLQ
jgi:hypothetical protein